MKKCELCNSVARMYCESDQATLCWDCDSRVHSANFLVSKHSRILLCRSCQSLTPWTASGPKLAPTLSICQSCVLGDPNSVNADDDEDHDDDVAEEEEEDDGENQVVPLNFPAGSSTASSSSSSENSSSLGYFQGRERDRAKSLNNGLVSGSSRTSGMKGVVVAGRVARGSGANGGRMMR